VTAQDKRIAGLIQRERKGAILVLNKWDLIKSRRDRKQMVSRLVNETRTRIFFLESSPVLIASALTSENIDQLFALIEKIRRAARQHIGTGVLNRLLRHAFEANPPPLVRGRRLKLFYSAQASGKAERQLQPPEFVLFVNDPRLMNETYRRYLEARLRKAEPYPGLPIILTLRARARNMPEARRRLHSPGKVSPRRQLHRV
jgi:GTP-binding protein